VLQVCGVEFEFESAIRVVHNSDNPHNTWNRLFYAILDNTDTGIAIPPIILDS
jgi:hypothetical protein